MADTPSGPPKPGALAHRRMLEHWIDLTNQTRTHVGLTPLAIDERLMNRTAEDVTDRERNPEAWRSGPVVGHTDSHGRGTVARVNLAGVYSAAIRENTAQTYRQTPEEVHQAFLDHSQHRRNMLDERLTRVGCAQRTAYWHMLFAGPQSGGQSPPPPAPPPPPFEPPAPPDGQVRRRYRPRGRGGPSG